jgi:hypothetical protein
MRPIPTVTAVASALAVASTSIAAAALPHPQTHRIAPGVSIGGLKIGAPAADATRAWGSSGECHLLQRVHPGETSCEYADDRTESTGSAYFNSRDGVIVAMTLSAPMRHDGPGTPLWGFTGPLTHFATGRGIRLGATLAATRHTYPHATLTKLPGGPPRFERLTIAGPTRTEFSFVDRRLYTIEIRKPGA